MASDSNMHACVNNRHNTAALTEGGKKHDHRYTSQTGTCGQCMNWVARLKSCVSKCSSKLQYGDPLLTICCYNVRHKIQPSYPGSCTDHIISS